jgi:para-aminobenzoate synthetase component 2
LNRLHEVLLRVTNFSGRIEFDQAMILLIDNYDSFTFNLSRYLIRLGTTVCVLRNDSADIGSAAKKCTAIVISPGPCGPEQAGQSISLVRQFNGLKPILGVCLGHQVIAHALGGRIIRATRPVHGKAYEIKMESHPLFSGIPQFSCFARYHSLIVDPNNLPTNLQIIAKSYRAAGESNETKATSNCLDEIMAIGHQTHPTYGVQFHPESVLSPMGYRLLANFLTISGIETPKELPSADFDAVASFK